MSEAVGSARSGDQLGVEGFVGRTTELMTLEQALASAEAQTANVVIVEGPAGIGKTSLVRRFLSELGERAAVVSSRGQALQRDVRWGVVGGVLGAAGAPDDEQGGASLVGVSASILEMIGSLQQRGKAAVIFIDDLHLADPPSNWALTLALKRLFGDRALVIGTVRPGLLPTSWEQLLEPMPSTHLRLRGLDRVALGDLGCTLGMRAMSQEDADLLERLSHGNPLFATRLLLHRTDGGAVAEETSPGPRSPDLAGVPLRAGDHSTSVAGSWARLGEATRRFLAAAAVLGESCLIRDAGALAGLEDPSEQLADARRQRLLEPEDQARPQDLNYAHNLVYQEVCHLVAPLEWRRLHAAAVEVTTGQERVRHLVAAVSQRDEAVAGEVERVALQEVAEGQLVLAAQHLKEASEIGEAGAAAERRLLDATVAFARAGYGDRAEELEPAVRSAASGPYREFALSLIDLVVGRLRGAEDHLERAWLALETTGEWSGPADLRGQVCQRMIMVKLFLGDYTAAGSWLERQRALPPEEHPEAGEEAYARAMYLGASGQGDAGLKEMAAHPVPGRLGRLSRGLLRLWTDDHLGVAEELSSELAVARAAEGGGSLPTWLYFLGEAMFRAGRLDAAIVNCDLAIDLAGQAGYGWDLPYAYAVGTYPHAYRGELHTAVRYAELAEATAAGAGATVPRAYAAAARVALAINRGDPEELLAAARDLHRFDPEGEPATNVFGPVEAEALVALGRLEEAEQALDRFAGRPNVGLRRSAQLGLFRVRATLAEARSESEVADRCFASADRLARELDLPIEVARLEQAWGRALRSRGREAEARVHLQQALSRLERASAKPLAGQLRDMLTDTASPTQLPDLSPAESEVVRLVAAGATNKAVARELFVSTKTVEFHLSNVYRKMGVTTRVAMTRRLLEVAPELASG